MESDGEGSRKVHSLVSRLDILTKHKFRLDRISYILNPNFHIIKTFCLFAIFPRNREWIQNRDITKPQQLQNRDITKPRMLQNRDITKDQHSKSLNARRSWPQHSAPWPA